MPDSEVQDIKRTLRSIQTELKENSNLTRQTFDAVSDRVSKLEVAEAKRQGRESVSKPEQVNWTKIILAIIGVASAAISLALLLAQRLLT